MWNKLFVVKAGCVLGVFVFYHVLYEVCSIFWLCYSLSFPLLMCLW